MTRHGRLLAAVSSACQGADGRVDRLRRSKSPPSAFYPGANSFARSTDLFAPSEVVPRVRIRFASTASPTNLPPWSDCLRPPTVPRGLRGHGTFLRRRGRRRAIRAHRRHCPPRCTAARLWVASSQVDGVDQRLPAASAHLDAMPFGGTRSLLRCRACGRRAASSISPSVPLLPAAGAVAAPVCREALEYPPPPTRRRRHSGLTVAFNWPTVYFANAFSPIKLSSGEDFGD
jgi:hypothetical protein